MPAGLSNLTYLNTPFDASISIGSVDGFVPKGPTDK
jgi:hypothetical protein